MKDLIAALGFLFGSLLLLSLLIPSFLIACNERREARRKALANSEAKHSPLVLEGHSTSE